MGVTLKFNDRDDIPDLEIQSLSWGAQHAIPNPDAGQRQAQMADVRLMRKPDRWSSILANLAASGKPLGTVTIVLSKDTSSTNTNTITIILTDVFITSYQTAGGGRDPSESFSLNFEKLEYRPDHYGDDDDGS